ncbi:MAG: hypothetical protein ABIG42_11085 [bacterium]
MNFLIWFVTAVKFTGYPYSLDFGEGILLVQSSMLMNGENIYPPISDYPYMVSNYHPLYPFLAGLPFLFLNPGLWSGRLITLLSAIGSMVLIGKIVFRSTKRIELGMLAALLPLCLSFTYNWAFIYRVDFLGVFLSLSGLYLYMYPRKKGGIHLSVIPFALAFFTKLNFILAPIACLIDLFYKKDSGRGKYLLFLILCIGIPYLLLNLITGFGMFMHTLVYTANIFHLDRMVEGYREILEYTLPIWFVIVIGVSVSNSKHKILLLSYLILLMLGLGTYGAEGSDSNYFLELLFVLPIAGLIWFPGFLTETKSETNIAAGFRFDWLALILIALFCLSGRLNHAADFGEARRLSQLVESGQQIDSFVSSCPGEVISEDLTFLAKNNKKMLFQPYIMSLLSRKGKWDQTTFVNDLSEKRFKLIILRFNVNDEYHTDNPEVYGAAGFDRFTIEMEKAISENYLMFGPVNMGSNSWYLYKPVTQKEN